MIRKKPRIVRNLIPLVTFIKTFLRHLATGEKRSPKHILEGHAGQVWCVAVSPDGSTIASASADFTVKLWNIETRDLLQTFTGHLGEVRSVAFSPDGKLLASSGDDLEVKLWRMQS